jgi:hypothetical protein
LPNNLEAEADQEELSESSGDLAASEDEDGRTKDKIEQSEDGVFSLRNNVQSDKSKPSKWSWNSHRVTNTIIIFGVFAALTIFMCALLCHVNWSSGVLTAETSKHAIADDNSDTPSLRARSAKTAVPSATIIAK